MNKPQLITIVGPTAIGKTSLSISLAKRLHCDIISCDSRQFFKEMNIGTAVPSSEELYAAKHHFIQNISIFQPYTVGDYEKDALHVLTQLFSKQKQVVMVGGSGLYVDAVTKGLDSFPKIDHQIRGDLQKELKDEGISSLQAKLKALDQVSFNKMDIENPQRVIRALEICIGTDQPYSSFLTNTEQNRPFTTIFIGLNADRDIIYERINQRVDLMVENGLVEEAKSLYPHRDLNALQTVGYKELFEYFDANITLEKAIENIKTNTRRFAKRQLTWFRKNQNIKWFDYLEEHDTILEYIQSQKG